ncbi:DUF881 domain-containing protein [Mobilicoccus pelagius]|uniref:DUF881 domain-containing protein n=1 Tax=Mobilicoccus pelagius NBRC 104925 TaxID=1089455 RepID=H5USU6_9MICO|nr:DUF881 domain-containing protein [Mobilicoccus pelagius]GAB48804.1 hypothetical protein MOPEL_083_00090 [Mobilicoccus pelagius NBRC 104925]
MTPCPRSVWTWIVPLVTGAAGLLFATSATTARGTDLRGDRPDLPALIHAREAEVARDAHRNDVLRREIAAQEQALPGGATLRTLREQEEELEERAGLTPVHGPAVRVTLDDAGLDAASLPEGVSVDDVVVHQQDVQAVVNALWAAGAEAMTIQDQRVLSTSAVRCVGNTLILGGRVYSPPFVVTAIGDQKALRAGLDADPAVAVYRDYVNRLGLGYRVETLEVTFGPSTGTVRPVHARPVTGGTASPTAVRTPSGRP